MKISKSDLKKFNKVYKFISSFIEYELDKENMRYDSYNFTIEGESIDVTIHILHKSNFKYEDDVELINEYRIYTLNQFLSWYNLNKELK